MGRAEGARGLELRVRDIDGDDRRRARKSRALHAVEADPAAADHDDARSRLDGGGVDDRAHAGKNAASDQRRAVERHRLRDDSNLARVDDDMIGESAGAHAVDDGRPGLVGERAFPVEREYLLAEHRRAFRARGAGAAGADEGRDDGIAHLQARHAGTDALDDSRRLVAVDRGQVAAPGAVKIENVAMADRAGGDLDPDLAGAGVRQFHLFDAERRPERAAHGGPNFHLFPLAGRPRGRRLTGASAKVPRGQSAKQAQPCGGAPDFCLAGR